MQVKVITRADWGARPPRRGYATIAFGSRPGMEGHHSVGTYGAGPSQPHRFARAVQADHLGRSWTDVFYNASVWYDGSIIELRPWNARSGAVRAFTVVFPGNTSVNALLPAQEATWRQLRAHLLARGVASAIVWHGMRAAVECPGADGIRFLSSPAARGTPAAAPIEEDDVRYHLIRSVDGRIFATSKWRLAKQRNGPRIIAYGRKAWHVPSPAVLRQMRDAGTLAPGQTRVPDVSVQTAETLAQGNVVHIGPHARGQMGDVGLLASSNEPEVDRPVIEALLTGGTS